VKQRCGALRKHIRRIRALSVAIPFAVVVLEVPGLLLRGVRATERPRDEAVLGLPTILKRELA
jgi:hypothetical protein